MAALAGLSVLKVVVSIAGVILFMTTSTNSREQLISRVIATVVGGIAGTVLMSLASFREIVTHLATLPRLGPLSQSAVIVGAVVLGYLLINGLYRLTRSNQPGRETALTIAILSMGLAVVGYVALISWRSPDATAYQPIYLSIGVLFGGLFFLMDGFAAGKLKIPEDWK